MKVSKFDESHNAPLATLAPGPLLGCGRCLCLFRMVGTKAGAGNEQRHIEP